MDLTWLSPVVYLLWLAGAVGFVLGLIQMNSPATARNGNLLSAGGMAVAIGATAVLLLLEARVRAAPTQPRSPPASTPSAGS